jgi:hypothetical protein
MCSIRKALKNILAEGSFRTVGITTYKLFSTKSPPDGMSATPRLSPPPTLIICSAPPAARTLTKS